MIKPIGLGWTLNYSWSFASKPAGSSAQLSEPSPGTATFILDVVGDYTIRRVCTYHDSAGASGTLADDNVTVSAYQNVSIVVSPYTSVDLGTIVTLNASAAAGAGIERAYLSRTFVSTPSGSAAGFSAPSSYVTSFTPDVIGDYQIQFVKRLTSDPASEILAGGTVTIHVYEPVSVSISTNPRSFAGVVANGSTVTLEGADTVVTLTATQLGFWTVTPPGQTPILIRHYLGDPGTNNTTFAANTAGTYNVSFAPTAGNPGWSANIYVHVPLVVTIATAPPSASGPVANGSTVTLEGTDKVVTLAATQSGLWHVQGSPGW